MAGQLIRVCTFAARSFKDGSFSADAYQAVSQEQYPDYLVVLVHIAFRLLMSLCRFSARGACAAAVCYAVTDVLSFFLERGMRRTLRPHEDALLDFAANMLVQEAFGAEGVFISSVVSGLLTFGLSAGLRLWAYFHRDKGERTKDALA